MRWVVVASVLMGLACACTALLGNDFEIVTSAAGGAGGAGDTGGNTGGDAGSGGDGGQIELPEITCYVDDGSTLLVADGEMAGIGPWERPMFVEENEGGVRLIIWNDMGGPIEIYAIDEGQTVPQPKTLQANKLHYVTRVDDSQIGVLYTQIETANAPQLFMRQYLDVDHDGNNPIDTALTKTGAYASSVDNNLLARFVSVGNGGGTALGDIFFAAQYLDATDSLFYVTYGRYFGTAVDPAVFAAPELDRNDNRPAFMLLDGGFVHLFSGDFPIGRQFMLDPDADPGIVTPRLLPMGQTAGEFERRPDGDLNAVGAILDLPSLEGRIGVVFDEEVADLDYTNTSLASLPEQSGNDILAGGSVASRWANDNYIQLGATVGSDENLVLRIAHISGQLRADESFYIAGGIGVIEAGGGIVAVSTIADNPEFFGNFDTYLKTVVLMDYGTFQRLYYLNIYCDLVGD